MENPRHLAYELLTRYKLKRPTLEDIVYLVGENGYEIIDFEPGSPSAENLFRELALTEAIYSQDAFLYTNRDVKLLFLKDTLDAEEKRVAAAHELGHIVCGHTQTRPSAKEEYEANEFVHFFLNPAARLRFRNLTARHKWRTAVAILAIAVIVVGGIVAYNSVIEQKYTNYYVTSSGKKYHLRSCSQISGKANLHRLSREELETGNYEACETCLREVFQASDSTETDSVK